MRTKGILGAMVGGIVFAMIGTTARADVAPPPGYVENCTLEKQSSADKECVECKASYQDAAICEKTYTSQGYAKACQSYGASVWAEIWCRSVSSTQVKDSSTPAPGLDSGNSSLDAGRPEPKIDGNASDANTIQSEPVSVQGSSDAGKPEQVGVTSVNTPTSKSDSSCSVVLSREDNRSAIGLGLLILVLALIRIRRRFN